jgi:excisionase family DNA binding protein
MNEPWNIVAKRTIMEPFNFNELPEVVRQLFEKVERIEMLMARLEPKDPDENEILNIEEAAEFLKVSVGALYTKVSRQEIPYSKPGKRLYFNRTDLKEWIRLGKRKTLPEIGQDADIQPYRNRMRPAIRRHIKTSI